MLAHNGKPTARRILRFGVFEFAPQSGELRKYGVKVRLQGQPLQILLALIERPGEIVTRDELRRRLWSADVFVDFDNGLNTAANRLRIALGDSAERPLYIETLARTGYRFIAPVELVDPATASANSPARRRRRLPLAVALISTLLVILTIGTVLAFRRASRASFEFRQVTFQRGQIWGARFAPDGHAVLYTANWDDGPRRLFLTNPVSPESRPLGFDGLRLVSVSRIGELALLSFDGAMPITGGTLSRVGMNGGVPARVDEDIMSADWSPDGRLAIVRAVEGANQLEFPVGTVLHRTPGWIGGVRFSPQGERIAFIEHPVRHDNRGSVKLADTATGRISLLYNEWADAGGLAWHPSRDEIWITASRDSSPKSLWAITSPQKARQLAQIAGIMTLRDIAPDGSALVSRDTARLEMAAVSEDGSDRDLSWLDWSRVADVSADGRVVLFDESGIAGGPHYTVYLRRLDEDSATRLGEGLGMGLSPDRRYALTLTTEDRARLHLLPLSGGRAIDLPPVGLEYQWVRYFPDGRRLLALGNEPGKPLRLFVQPLEGKPFPITPPTVVRNVAISPDGARVALMEADRKLRIYPTTGDGTTHLVPTPEPLAPLLWTDGDWLFVQHVGAYTQLPTQISRLNLSTGQLQRWREVRPRNTAGVNAITKIMLSADSRTVIFNYRRVLSELFVVEPQR